MGTLISDKFKQWETDCKTRFDTLKSNEEELNRLFIEIYGLQEELTPEVVDKDVTVRLANQTREIKSLISYAVGCLFGRYSLDCKGLAYAGGDWDSSKYVTLQPVEDNCLVITEENFQNRDITSRFIEFLKVVYGEDTLGENLDFVATSLGGKGTSIEVITNYFLKDFFKDHVKIYQKRPIYWLYDSGKLNGFKALVYMHRYNTDTTGLVRTDYLHKVQATNAEAQKSQEYAIENGSNRSKAEKKLEILKKQQLETESYDHRIGHLANCRIDIDLDDGVKVNYEKVQTGQDGKKLEILGKI